MSWDVQSASLPGSAGPLVTFLRTTLRLARSLRWALVMAISAIRSPDSGCWESQRLSASLAIPETKAAHSRDARRSLVWPVNCGSVIFTDSTCAQRSQTSSGASFTPRGRRLRNSQYSRTASSSPVRSPFTWVPPWGVGTRFT